MDPYDFDCGFEGDEDEARGAAAGNPMEGAQQHQPEEAHASVAESLHQRVTAAELRAAVAEAHNAYLNARMAELERARIAAEVRAGVAEATVKSEVQAARLEGRIEVTRLESEMRRLRAELEAAMKAVAASSSASAAGGAAASSSGPESLIAVPSIPVDIQSKLQSILVPQRLSLSTSMLLYSMSRDGPTAAAWHAAVDGVPHMLTLIRVKEYWFGGCTAVGFGGETGFKSDLNAFMFTLTNPHGIPPTVYRLRNKKAALYQNAEYGPIFNGGMGIQSPFDSNRESWISFPIYFADKTGKGRDTFHMEGMMMVPGRTGWTVSGLHSFRLELLKGLADGTGRWS